VVRFDAEVGDAMLNFEEKGVAIGSKDLLQFLGPKPRFLNAAEQGRSPVSLLGKKNADISIRGVDKTGSVSGRTGRSLLRPPRLVRK